MLLPHNINVFKELERKLEEDNCCCVVMGTGCGKTYVASEYLDKNNYKALVVSPRKSINKAWENHRSSIETITYQKLAGIYKDIDFSKYDVVICDEVHHIGAPKWGEPIKYLIDNNIVKVIGLTESSIRYTDGGKDVAEDFFYENVVYGENVSSAIEKKILNPVTYVGAMYNSDGLKKTLRGKIQSRLYAKLNLALNKTPTVVEILKKHMPKGKRKGIIFASTIEDIKSAMEFVKSVYPKVEIKFVHSKQPHSYNEETFEWFKKTDEGYICSVDMISEGVHIKGVNTLIMLRRTESVNLFNQQLGRCLDASSKEPAILFDLVNNKYSIKIINNKLKIKTNSIFDSGKLNVVPSEQLIINDYTKDIIEVLKEIKLNIEGNWTEEEDNLIRDFYDTHPGGTGFRKFYREIFKIQFPKRTYSSVHYRSNFLGLTTPNRIPFSKEEEDLIRKYYPIEGQNCYARFNNRSKQTIVLLARKLGIKSLKNIWTEEELKIIRTYYAKEGKNIAKRIPNKSIDAIKRMANKMGIYSSAYYKEWTKEETNILINNYATCSMKQLLEMIPKHDKNSIRARVARLNLKKCIQKIKCIETGKIYNSGQEAIRDLNIDNINGGGHITACCKGIRPTAYGYHWEYAK